MSLFLTRKIDCTDGQFSPAKKTLVYVHKGWRKLRTACVKESSAQQALWCRLKTDVKVMAYTSGGVLIVNLLWENGDGKFESAVSMAPTWRAVVREFRTQHRWTPNFPIEFQAPWVPPITDSEKEQ